MSERLIIDPVTRIEGHLRIEAKMTGNVIQQAYSSGTMVRGIEIILKGRDPRDAWAFTQRICGVCTLVHAMASIRAVEDALHYPIPDNARLIRNLMIAAQYVHDHVMHFYHLHALDWVDLVSALSADPKATAELAQAVGKSPNASPAYFADARQRLQQFAESGQLGLFGNAYWGHPAFKLPPEANLMAVAHYLEALSWQREVVQLHTIFGGKNPHPNFVVGGVPCAISLESGRQAGTAVDMAGLSLVQSVIRRMRSFVDQYYIPDVMAIGGFYKEWAVQGRGEGIGNFLSYGEFPGKDLNDPSSFLIPAGAILDRNPEKIHAVDLRSDEQIQEFITSSWYTYQEGRDKGLHPFQGETTLNYTGPKPPYQELPLDQPYSWLKSPRWRGEAMEVGPLARVLMLYGKGHEGTQTLVKESLHRLQLPMNALFSTLGRTVARALETQLIADAMQGWYDALLDNIRQGDLDTFNEKKWDPLTWPKKARGVGAMEAPRGALAHWVSINQGKIENYQAVVPSTWNAGPRDAKGKRGPYEAALEGEELHDPNQPLEVLRTIHSFDPCIACAVHLMDEEGKPLMQLKVR